MMQRNQARLTELHTDFKQVSKLVEEPYVNVRKVKQPSVIARKKQALRMKDGAVDENMDAQNVWVNKKIGYLHIYSHQSQKQPIFSQ